MSKYNFDLNLNLTNSLSLILKRIEPKSTILEFGPANGRMTKYLKEEMGCKVYTVELDEKAAKDAEKYSEEIIVGNIEEYTWLEKYKKIKFDYIVFADVLEHLYYPEKVLDRTRELLKEEGSILFSIPNIAHNVIIMELLTDQFTYNSVGLLDDTHIRFFTKNSLDKMIKGLRYHVVYESGLFVPPLQTEFHKNYSDIDKSIADYLKKRALGEVYQYVYELKKYPGILLSELNEYTEYKLYFDLGEGFCEENTVVSRLQNNRVDFDLSKISKKIVGVRLDPTEQAINIKIKSFYIDGEEFKSRMLHNGLSTKGEIKFLHHDPQISIIFEECIAIEKISVVFDKFELIENLSAEFLTIQELELEEFRKKFDEAKKSLTEKERSINHIHSELLEKELLLQQKNQEIQEKEQQINHLHELIQSMQIKNRIKKLLGLYK